MSQHAATRPRSLSRSKIRDARLASLLCASLDYEDKPHLDDLARMVLGAARAWARADRDVRKGGARGRLTLVGKK